MSGFTEAFTALTFPTTDDDNTTALSTSTLRPVMCHVHYPLFMKCMYVYILPLLIILGLVGNSLAFTVFWRQRKECAHERTELLSFLAMVDSFYLVTAIFSRFLPTLAKYHNQPALFWSIWTRPAAYAVASSGQMMAAYTLVLVTAHRYALICHPLKVAQLMSTRRTATILTTMAVFCFVYNIPRLFELSVQMRTNTCLGDQLFPTLVRTDFGSHILYQVIYLNLLRFLIRGLIPVVSQFILTVAITRQLRARSGSTNIRRRTMTLAHVLVVVAIVYLFCQIPPWLSSILNSSKRLFNLKIKDLNYFHSYFVILCNMLLTFNSATNFVIYIFCGSQFKRVLRELCSCGCRFCPGRQHSSPVNYTVNPIV